MFTVILTSIDIDALPEVVACHAALTRQECLDKGMEFVKTHLPDEDIEDAGAYLSTTDKVVFYSSDTPHVLSMHWN